MTRPRLLTQTLCLAAAVAALLAALVLALAVAWLDWNLAKPWVTAQAVRLLQRPVQIDGDLQLAWAAADSHADGVSRWLPQIRVQARQVAVGNADWATATSGAWLARAQAVDLRLAPWALLRKHWQINALQLTGAEVTLERGSDGRQNWRFTSSQTARWTYHIADMQFDRIAVRYVDQPLVLDLRAQLLPNTGQTLPLAASLSGRWRQVTVTGSGQGAALPQLLNDGGQYALQANGEAGQVKVQVAGQLINPHRLARADLQLALDGPSLAALTDATGVPLPRTRPFHTKGALQVSRTSANAVPSTWDWHYGDFSGTVGESDFSGNAHYRTGAPRPQLQATVTAGRLRLADVLDDAQGDAGQRAPGKLLSEHALQPGRWQALDAQVSVSVRQLALLPSLTGQDLRSEIQLKDQILTVQPVRLTIAGGLAGGWLQLDGRQAQIRAHLQLDAQQLQLRQLLPGLAQSKAPVGQLDGHVVLEGEGNSVAALLASAHGQVNATTGRGSISQFMLAAAGLNLADAVFAKLYRDRQVALYCGVGAARIEQGQAHLTQFMLNTEDAVIDMTGTVDLRQESLDLDIRPHNKTWRVLSLTTPLTVTGSFSQPRIGVAGKGLAARAGAAAALALVAPVAALAPLVTPGEDLPNDCPQLPAPPAQQD